MTRAVSGRARIRTAAVLVALVLAAACERAPRGPGALSATVEGPVPLGAALVEVRGSGVTGFEGAGTTLVFSAEEGEGVHRVVLVGEAAGDLRFRVRVADVREDRPSAHLVSAADGDNLPVASVHVFTVRIAR